jgi:hypothetical protein
MGAPVLVIEEVFKHIDLIKTDQAQYKLFVPAALAFEGQAIPPAVGMQLILSRLMDQGFSYRGAHPMGAGLVYRYVRWFTVPQPPRRA